MKVELTVKQRINLQSILPAQGDFLTMKMLRVLREDLSFSQKEHELLKFKQYPNGSVEWDSKAESEKKKIEIPETIVNSVKEILERANAAKKITEAHLDFYEMFMSLEDQTE